MAEPLRVERGPNEESNAGRRGVAADRLRRAAPAASPLTRMLVRSGARLVVLAVDEIDWIESAGNYVCLHRGSEPFLVRRTLAELEARLDAARFVRAHRTTLVNLDAIAEIRQLANGSGVLRLRCGAEIAVSRRLRRRLLDAVERT